MIWQRFHGALAAVSLLALSSILGGCPVEEGCGHSLCGCPRPFELTVSSRVVDASMAPIEGAVIACSDGAGGPVSSGPDGAFSLTVATTRIETCETTECGTITITSPDGAVAREVASELANQRDVLVLEGPDGG